MKTFYLISLLVFAGLVTSCKKEPLPELPEENDPYYSIRGLVNGDSINWEVGENGITLSHGVSSMNGVESFYGQINGASGQAVRIELLRPEIAVNSSGLSTVSEGELDFLVHQAGAVKFNFGLNYAQANYVLVKDANNNYVVMNQVPFPEFGVHDVSMKFTDYGSQSFTIPIKFGFEDVELRSGFTSSGDGNVVTLTPYTAEGSHKWYLNGALVSHDPVFTSEMDNGIHTVTHEVTDAFSNKSNHTTLVRIKDNELYWQLKYYYVPPVQSSSHYGNVIVSYLKNGVWYHSSKLSSNLSKAFMVSNIETTLNSQMEPLWTIFDFSFGATLYNENQTDSLYLPGMVGTVNVALQ